MPPLPLRPGVVLDDTALRAAGFATASDKIVWVNGAAQAMRGWERAADDPVPGISRSGHAWSDTAGNVFVAIGSHSRLMILFGAALHNITPARSSGTLAADPITTAAGSATVSVHHVAHGAGTGDTVYLTGATSIGGITVGGATGTLAASPLSTEAGSSRVVVLVPGHGQANNSMLTLTGAAAIGGIPAAELNAMHIVQVLDENHLALWTPTAASSTVEATDAEVPGPGGGGTPGYMLWRPYDVTVVDADHYTIEHSAVAVSTATGGGASVAFVFEIPVGLIDGTEPGGYGVGAWDEGAYGLGLDNAEAGETQPRTWSLVHWGEDLAASPLRGPIYTWSRCLSQRAVAVDRTMPGRPDIRAPRKVTALIVTGERFAMALGCEPCNFSSLRGFTADPAADLIEVPAHGWADGIGVLVRTTGLLPDPLVDRQVYYVRDAATDTFRLAGSPGGPAINLLDAGQGDLDIELADPPDLPFDPMLIRWSTDQDMTEWVPRIDNNAGDLRLGQGSRIVGALNAKAGVLVWTDTALYLVRYRGSFDQTYEEDHLGTCGLIGPQAAVERDGIAYWLTPSGTPYVYAGGTPRPMPSRLNQWTSRTLAPGQGYKVVAAFDGDFYSVMWLIPAADTNECSRYIRRDLMEVGDDPAVGWSVGTMDRTMWLSDPLLPRPIAVAPSGTVYFQDTGYSADGEALIRHVEWAPVRIGDGRDTLYITGALLDVSVGPGGALRLTFKGRRLRHSAAQAESKGPYTVTADTRYVEPRMTAHELAVRVESAGSEDDWRFGVLELDAAEGPRR